MTRPTLVFLLFFIASLAYKAQVNCYAKVTAISSNVLTLSNANQTFDTFVAGERVLIIQMQGADINGFTSNNSSFGVLSAYNSAGLYEFAYISAVNGAATSMTLTAPLGNAYDVLSGLQVVSYPKLGVGTTGFATTANITGLNWDGNIGGVITFYVQGNLTLNHNITADGIGFRGGATAGQDGSPCESTTWRTTTGSPKYADKGEGIHLTTAGQKSGKAKCVNGGGAGIVHNGGGGGGGNFTSGGAGYFGFPGDGCGVGTDAGGQGALAVTSSATRIFLGGGGGGGQENNALATPGGNGGGIIMIKCDTIVVTGSCSSHTISANGEVALDSGRDGSGGGGAGGSILIENRGLRVKSGCPLNIVSNGGNGGNVIHFDTHGSGGGGGQGTIYLNSSASMLNVTLGTNFGSGGAADSLPSPAYAGDGGGPANAGIFSGAFTSPLPVELMNLQAREKEHKTVALAWQTATEKNNMKFEIFHSSDGKTWEHIGTKEGAGDSHQILNYEFLHYGANYDLNYYRLRQVDFDGGARFSGIVYAQVENVKLKVNLFPNPSEGVVNIESSEDLSGENLILMDSFGNKLVVECRKNNNTSYSIDLSAFEKGIYFLYSQNICEKIIVK